MSVSFNSSLVANQKVAFGKNSENSSNSYVVPALKGAVAGGVIGVGTGFAIEKAAAIQVAGDKFLLSNVNKVAKRISGSAPVQNYACGGIIIGAIALLARTITKNKTEDSAARLKPIS